MPLDRRVPLFLGWILGIFIIVQYLDVFANIYFVLLFGLYLLFSLSLFPIPCKPPAFQIFHCSCSCQGHWWLQHCQIQWPLLSKSYPSYQQCRFESWLLPPSWKTFFNSPLRHQPPGSPPFTLAAPSQAPLPSSKLEAWSSDLLSSLCTLTPRSHSA